MCRGSMPVCGGDQLVAESERARERESERARQWKVRGGREREREREPEMECMTVTACGETSECTSRSSDLIEKSAPGSS
jgi:hypothetical protein